VALVSSAAPVPTSTPRGGKARRGQEDLGLGEGGGWRRI
jgi:hypothetical protein